MAVRAEAYAGHGHAVNPTGTGTAGLRASAVGVHVSIPLGEPVSNTREVETWCSGVRGGGGM